MAMPQRVVLISSRIKHIEKVFLMIIKKYVPNSIEMNFLEVGAGYAKITKLAVSNFRWKSVVAIELEPLVVCWNKLKNHYYKLPVTYIASNIFKYNIPKGSVIYCYMSVPVLNRLYQEDSFDESLVLSLSFKIPKVEPTAEYAIKGFQKVLYVYDFRKTKTS